mgnify:CR=1 FL=1
MPANYTIKTDQELFESPKGNKGFIQKVRVATLYKKQIATYFDTTIYIRSSLFILVLNGSVQVDINFKHYEVKKDALVQLSFGHFFKPKWISGNFKCLLLYIGKDYIDEMYSTEMIYKRIKYGVKLHSTPVLNVGCDGAALFQKRLDFAREILGIKGHRYHQEMILHTLLIFLLDLGNIVESASSPDIEQKLSRDELYFQQFLDLLVNHYKKEHQVYFYAQHLHITPHYLTLIVKRLTGQTVSDFIFQLLYSEAKILLQQPNLTIQQIADSLHFSDQSAFGKFFKRNSGLSPNEFRKKMTAG